MWRNIRAAGQAAATIRNLGNLYNYLPSWDSVANFGTRLDESMYEGSVPVSSNQEAADRAYIARASGYRLNPDNRNLATRLLDGPSSSVGHVFYGS